MDNYLFLLKSLFIYFLLYQWTIFALCESFILHVMILFKDIDIMHVTNFIYHKNIWYYFIWNN